MKFGLPFLLLLAPQLLESQMNSARDLFERYDSFKLHSITSRRFSQAQMEQWLVPILKQEAFDVIPIGTSAEGRPISLYSFGHGSTSVLLWSQMHGDEPTATMALLDIMNYFAHHAEDQYVSKIRKDLRIYILPMLNPDGAEYFQRRTAQQVDLNRDALQFETPEAKTLRRVCETYRPDFGFNLHDQDPRYTAGQSKRVTAIALLAPAFGESLPDNDVRLRAKHVAAGFAEAMNMFVPGHVARYDDTFEPRAFGDNIQKWGTSTVLVESGGWMGDREKMFLRKLNSVGLLVSLYGIAVGDVEKNDITAYERLPLNGKNFFDLILREIHFQASPSVPLVRLDVGINYEEKLDSTSAEIILWGTVTDMGDLSTFGAFEEFECNGLTLDSSAITMDKKMKREEFLRLIPKR